MITNGCRKIGIPLYLTENANHSMETGDTLHDIFILHDIMDETAHWMDSLRDRRFPFTFSALYDKIDYHNEEVCL